MNITRCNFPEWVKRPLRGEVEKQKRRSRAGPLFSWNRRYFVVEDGWLRYYHTAQQAAADPKGEAAAFSVPIRDIVNVRSVSGVSTPGGSAAARGGRPGSAAGVSSNKVRAGLFEVVTVDRRFLLRSPSEEEADRWLLAIQYRMWQCQQRAKQQQEALNERWRRHALVRDAQSDMAMDKLMGSTAAAAFPSDRRRTASPVFTTGVFSVSAADAAGSPAGAGAAEHRPEGGQGPSPAPPNGSAGRAPRPARRFRVSSSPGPPVGAHRTPTPPVDGRSSDSYPTAAGESPPRLAREAKAPAALTSGPPARSQGEVGEL